MGYIFLTYVLPFIFIFIRYGVIKNLLIDKGIHKFKYTFIFYWKKDKSNFKKQAIKHLKQSKE